MTAKFRQGTHKVADEWDGQAVAVQQVYGTIFTRVLIS